MVDVTITATSGPLQGKTCRLMRRTIKIVDYPAVREPGASGPIEP